MESVCRWLSDPSFLLRPDITRLRALRNNPTGLRDCIHTENNRLELTPIRSECLSRSDLPCKLFALHRGVNGSYYRVESRGHGLPQMTKSLLFFTITGEKSTQGPVTTVQKRCSQSDYAQHGPSFQLFGTSKCHLPAHAKQVCTVFRSHFGLNIRAMRLNGLGPHARSMLKNSPPENVPELHVLDPLMTAAPAIPLHRTHRKDRLTSP